MLQVGSVPSFYFDAATDPINLGNGLLKVGRSMDDMDKVTFGFTCMNVNLCFMLVSLIPSCSASHLFPLEFIYTDKREKPALLLAYSQHIGRIRIRCMVRIILAKYLHEFQPPCIFN